MKKCLIALSTCFVLLTATSLYTWAVDLHLGSQPNRNLKESGRIVYGYYDVARVEKLQYVPFGESLVFYNEKGGCNDSDVMSCRLTRTQNGVELRAVLHDACAPGSVEGRVIAREDGVPSVATVSVHGTISNVICIMPVYR